MYKIFKINCSNIRSIVFKTVIICIAIFIVFSSSITCNAIKIKSGEIRNKIISLPFGIGLVINDAMLFSGDNDQVSDEQKEFNNFLIAGTSVILIIYWFVLLYFCEKEELYDYTHEMENDIMTLRKYNPMIAGCLTDNRDVLPRDVTAVILGLIQKDYVKMDMVPNPEIDKENYVYMISPNKGKVGDLDEIERYVLNWIFGFYEVDEIDLVSKLKSIAKEKDFNKHIEDLNEIAQKELHKIGANIPKVPKFLRIFNIALAIFSIFMSVIHILNNGISIHIYQSTVFLFLLILAGIFIVIPVVAALIHLSLILLVLLKKLIKSTSDKYSGKKTVKRSALILIFLLILILIVYFVSPNKYICLDILMIGIALLIVRTDNVMTKHNKKILNDYYALNEIKYRIEEYSLIKEEQINYIKLWDEYLVYAVAFGIPIPIVNKLKSTNREDNDLAYLAKCECLYYICKAYLEVMWDMDFKSTKKSKKRNIFLDILTDDITK